MLIWGVRLSGGREERTSDRPCVKSLQVTQKAPKFHFTLTQVIKNNKGILLHAYIKHKGLFLIFAHRAARE